MRIAVVDDDPVLSALIVGICSQADIATKAYGDAESLAHDLTRESFDAMLIDWVLPRMNGIDLIRNLRRQRNLTVPIIVITGRDSDSDVVMALESGADDFIVKPVRPAVLIARLRAVVRRRATGTEEHDVFEYDRYRFDQRTRTAFKGDQEVELTQKEFLLALLLMRNLGTPLSRSHIMETVWGSGTYVASRTIDTHMSRVRTKLDWRAEHGYLLSPVYSFGYRLERRGNGADNSPDPIGDNPADTGSSAGSELGTDT